LDLSIIQGTFFFCRAVPNPNIAIRHFFITVQQPPQRQAGSALVVQRSVRTARQLLCSAPPPTTRGSVGESMEALLGVLNDRVRVEIDKGISRSYVH
jgi:hypothetical protein